MQLIKCTGQTHCLPIKNCVVNTGYRERAYQFMAREVAAGDEAGVCNLSHGGGKRND